MIELQTVNYGSWTIIITEKAVVMYFPCSFKPPFLAYIIMVDISK